jgi:hypothetical protein
MIRTVVTSNNNILTVPIPDKYIGRQIEVIAFAVDEPLDDVIIARKDKKTFTAVKLNTKGYKFNRDEANER